MWSQKSGAARGSHSEDIRRRGKYRHWLYSLALLAAAAGSTTLLYGRSKALPQKTQTPQYHLVRAAFPQNETRQERQERLHRDLIAAIERNDTQAVVALLKQGADPNAPAVPRDKGHGRHFPLVDVRDPLVEALALRNAGDMLMAIAPPENVSLIKALLDSGADVNGPGDPMEGSPLTCAILAGHHKVTQLLLDRKAEVNPKDARKDMDTPLTAAVHVKDVGLINHLLDRGADINGKDCVGYTPLIFAAMFGDVRVVNVLLHRGARINMQNKNGETALIHGIIENPNPEVVRALLKHHADVTLKDNYGHMALSWARTLDVDGDMDPIIKMLKQAGAKE